MSTLNQKLTRSAMRMHWRQELALWRSQTLRPLVRRAWCRTKGAHEPGVVLDRGKPIAFYCPKCRVRSPIPAVS